MLTLSCFDQLRRPSRLLEPGGEVERPDRVRAPGLLPAQLQSGGAQGGGHPGGRGGDLPVSGGLQGTRGEEGRGGLMMKLCLRDKAQQS